MQKEADPDTIIINPLSLSEPASLASLAQTLVGHLEIESL
jgi:hypothetical protein